MSIHLDCREETMRVKLDLQQLEKSIQQAVADFEKHCDVNQILEKLRAHLNEFIEDLVASILHNQLLCQNFLTILKIIAGNSGFRFNGYTQTNIRLLSGRLISIRSPYFKKAESKRRGPKRKKRKAKSGCHLGLAYLGLIERVSSLLSSSVVQAALLCPSFQIAKQTLRSFGIEMGVKTIQRLCRNMGELAMKHRPKIALSHLDDVGGRILAIFIDGGRLRERRPKRGKRPADQKRQGYHTEWREPIQLVIEWLNADGSRCNETPPLYDATMSDIDKAFDLLESYLRQLDISRADKVVFCADGARQYWKRFSLLAQKLNIKEHYEIIDYTHAKQNLYEIIEKLPKNLGAKKIAKIIHEWKNLLWQGNLDEIKTQIRSFIKSRTKYKEAMTKFKNYFLSNYHRFQYTTFRDLNLPTGSGCVESAIRRVINLRLKSPGTFWKRQTAETMLFLRSTLLCGRWNIMLNNLLLINRGQFS